MNRLISIFQKPVIVLLFVSGWVFLIKKARMKNITVSWMYGSALLTNDIFHSYRESKETSNIIGIYSCDLSPGIVLHICKRGKHRSMIKLVEVKALHQEHFFHFRKLTELLGEMLTNVAKSRSVYEKRLFKCRFTYYLFRNLESVQSRMILLNLRKATRTPFPFYIWMI